MNWFDIIYYSTVATSILPLIALALFPKALKEFSKEVRRGLMAYFIYNVLHHAAQIILLDFLDSNPIPAVHISICLEFYILLYLFHAILPIKHIQVITIAGILPFLADAFWISSLSEYIKVSSIIYFFANACFAFRIIYKIGLKKKESSFVTAIFLYFLACFVHEAFANLMIVNPIVLDMVFPLFALINAALSIAFMWGIIRSNRSSADKFTKQTLNSAYRTRKSGFRRNADFYGSLSKYFVLAPVF